MVVSFNSRLESKTGEEEQEGAGTVRWRPPDVLPAGRKKSPVAGAFFSTLSSLELSDQVDYEPSGGAHYTYRTQCICCQVLYNQLYNKIIDSMFLLVIGKGRGSTEVEGPTYHARQAEGVDRFFSANIGVIDF